MSRQNLVRFNVGGTDPLTPFMVKVNSSYTIPESKTQPSAVNTAFGGALLASTVQVVGGQLMLAVNDGAAGASTTVNFDLTREEVCDLRPGDVVAMSAIVSNVVTLTVTSTDGSVRTFLITGVTTYAVAFGYWA